MKKCSTCKQNKTFEDFHKDRSSKDGYSNRCKACRVISSKVEYKKKKTDPKYQKKAKEWQKKYYASGKPRQRNYEMKKKFLAEFGGACQGCGYSKCLAALEFHHKDPSKKEFSLGSGIINEVSWDKCLMEASKCILLCNRCHREEHHLEQELKAKKKKKS